MNKIIRVAVKKKEEDLLFLKNLCSDLLKSDPI